MSWFPLTRFGALRSPNEGRYATCCVTRTGSALVGEAVLWLSELECSGDAGLTTLAVAAGLTLRPMPIRGLKPFRDAYSLFYSDTCSPEWLRAFFVREIARRALEAVGCEPTADAVEDVSDAVRRCAVASSRSAKPVSAAAAKNPERERPVSAVLRLDQPLPLGPA